jgi:hypothetical protein
MNAHIVFCDDIRQEANGKFLLIGVYAGELVVAPAGNEKPPLMVTLATYIEMSDLQGGTTSLEADVRFKTAQGTKTVNRIEWQNHVGNPEVPSVLAPTGLRLPVDETGTLEIYIRHAGSSEEILGGRLNIILASSSTETPLG